MARAARMHVNRRARLGETPRGARVIEMDVAQKDVANVVRREAHGVHRRRDVGKSCVRSGIEERDAVVRLERGRGDDPGPTEMPGVENMDHRVGPA